MPLADLPATMRELLGDIDANLFAQARDFLARHTFAPRERSEFYRMLQDRAGMIDIPWCERAECEAHVKEETSASSRNMRPLRDSGAACVACGEPARVQAYFAQSY